MNNDGKDDLIIGAPIWNNNTGRAFVVYGQPPCPMKMYLSGNGTCKNCTLGNGCGGCDVTTGVCNSCQVNYWLVGTTCVTCNSTCAICNGTTKACDGCQSGQHINGLGCSPCGKMMWNNITRGTTCQACTGCQECDPTNGHCTMCQWNEGINSTIFQCKSCTTEEWSNPTGVACVKCDLSNGCKSCNVSSGKCTNCSMGGTHININGTGCANCTQMC